MRMHAVIFIVSFFAVLSARGQERTEPETFIMEQGDSTVIMQKYFVVFLKAGPSRDQSEAEAARIQEQHLAHLTQLYKDGHISLAGPFADDGDIRGVAVFNTATADRAHELASAEPAVQAGRLVVELHPWWLQKGTKLK